MLPQTRCFNTTGLSASAATLIRIGLAGWHHPHFKATRLLSEEWCLKKGKRFNSLGMGVSPKSGFKGAVHFSPPVAPMMV
jgi:hypothetical protein